MLPINIIDELIEFAHHRIDYLRIDKNDKNINNLWDDGYHSGYIAAMHKYINDLVYLKNRLININLDDDDV